MSGCRSPMPPTCRSWPAICSIPTRAMRQPAQALAAGLGPQSALWPTSISGDFPIFALRIGDVADLEIVASTLRMQEYMRARGVVADLVIVNEQASSYVQDLQQAIEWLCENSRLRGSEHGPRQHIFAVRRDLMDERTYRTLLVGRPHRAAHPQRADLRPDRARRVRRAAAASWRPSPRRSQEILPKTGAPGSRSAGRPCAAEPDGSDLAFWNGYGGFADGGREYVVRLAGDRSTPHPWINVIANSVVRLPHLGRGRVLHLEPQQPRFPADAVDQRPRAQPSGRGDLHLRPGLRTRLLADRRRRARPRHPLRGAARPGL